MTSIATSVLVTRPQRYSTSGRGGGDQLFRVPGWDQSPGVGNAVEPSTPSGYRQALRQRIEHPTIGIGRIKLQKLTAVRLDCFYRDLKDEGYAKATI